MLPERRGDHVPHPVGQDISTAHLEHARAGVVCQGEHGAEVQIVGEDEADIRNGRISFASPIARALIGKRIGEVAEVAAPGRTCSYEITAVRYT